MSPLTYFIKNIFGMLQNKIVCNCLEINEIPVGTSSYFKASFPFRLLVIMVKYSLNI